MRLERQIPGSEEGVPLPRAIGDFLVERVSRGLGSSFNADFDLLSEEGERLRLLMDCADGTCPRLSRGETIALHYSRRAGALGLEEWALSIRDEDQRLRFFTVARSPESDPFRDEEELPATLRPQPTRERLYLETLRAESYCTTRRAHLTARLGGDPERPIRPGETITAVEPDGTWRVHLNELTGPGQSDCEDGTTGTLAYEVAPTS